MTRHRRWESVNTTVEPWFPEGRSWPRGAGILAHPTSLPGPFPWGNCGDAIPFVDWLADAGVRYWQVLPLEPAGPGDSPYMSPSAFALDTRLVDPRALVDGGWLKWDEIECPTTDPSQADFERGTDWHRGIVRLAARRFFSDSDSSGNDDLHAWRDAHVDWVDDHCRFVALKEAHGGVPWPEWIPDSDRMDEESVSTVARFELFAQWQADVQWQAVRKHARERGILVVGDVPIFVASDSVDVWRSPHLFRLSASGAPEVLAGVPPDYFSATGQRWGNPHYRWENHAVDGFAWWGRRMRRALDKADRLRIDHFRGFCAAWAIDPSAQTAELGAWEPGPGSTLFDTLRARIPSGPDGALPLVAEDLGVITPDVTRLRDDQGLPGMRILQFAFDSDEENDFLPHRYPAGCVAYTGTHDNDTTAGWWASASESVRERVRRHLRRDVGLPGRDLSEWIWNSAADVAVVPLQDVWNLGSEARMNVPGTVSGNWRWRSAPPTEELARALASALDGARRGTR